MISNRRDFLYKVAASSIWLTAGRANPQPIQTTSTSSLRVLILGGTGNIGPYHVRAAVARGHRVSVFSRGISSADLPSGVERLIGDRNSDLASIRSRDWDAVVDLATYGPGWVRSLGEAIGNRTRHYTFVSTISVYDNPAANDETNEDSPILQYEGSADPYTISKSDEHYGALKYLCELEAIRQFSDRAGILRPGFIGGPDETHGVLSYWAARGELGGEILAGGNPATPVQYIDVRDMAEWVIRLVEDAVVGTFNTLTPMIPLSDIVSEAALAAAVPPAITWVPSDWLAMQGGPGSWGTLLFWEANEGYLTRVSNARAVANGLTFRPVRVTLADTLAWYRQQPAEMQSTLNAGFQFDSDTGDFIQTRIAWPQFLERETATLAAWRSEQLDSPQRRE